jgi:phosphoglycolate phosphatase
LDDIADAANVVLAAYGMPPRTRNEVCRFVGNGIPKLIERAVPQGTDADTIARMVEDYKAYYGAHSAEKTAPYAGIPEMLAALRERGVRTAVVSNKADFAVKPLATKYFGDLFDVALGEDSAKRPAKPAPDMVYHVLETLGVSKDEAAKIADELKAAGAEVEIK